MKRFAFISGAIAFSLTLTSCAGTPIVLETSVTSQPDETSAAKASIAANHTGTATPTASPDPSTSATRVEVSWADYDPGTQSEIDRMTNAGDCLGLNSYFGLVTASEESVKARTGHGNEALAKYLNESLAIAHCG